MTRVVGIDPSLTGTTLALDEDDVVKITSSLRGVERLRSIRDQVLALIGPEPCTIALEGYAHGRANQAHQIGELGGVLRVALAEAGHRVIEVSPAARAKWATGKGNAGKDAVVSAVSARLGRVFVSNDHVDAFVLRDVVVVLCGGTSALGEITAYRAAVLAALRKEAA